MICTVPFRLWHYKWIVETIPAGQKRLSHLSDAVLQQLEKENSYTLVVDMMPIACAGTIRQWPGRCMAWAYFDLRTGPYMLRITREAKRRLAEIKGRIEFTVRADFAAGQRWAEMLGFKMESPLLKAYGPQGEDHIGYARIT